MYTQEEKILILGSLFHDIGKFEQRCTGNQKRETHQSIGEKLIDDFDYMFKPIVGNDLTGLKKIIKEHHNKNVDKLTSIVQIADWISAGERVKKEETEKDLENKWNHKYLSSLFSKINLNSSAKIDTRYYRQEYLINENYNVLIPKFETEEEAFKSGSQYTSTNWKEFTDDIKIVFESFIEESDFDSLINMILLVFEKYMWCIPDFTGSSETDISLYNHLKDVCAISHSIYLSQRENANNKKLCLLIGDIPGIQKYIFNVLNSKAAKMLRGRSDFIQILSRNFATEVLQTLGITECNLIMLAGGKFYILAPYQSEEKFNKLFDKVKSNIDKYLYNEFKLDLQFAAGKYVFNYEDLKESKITFGEIIENANSDLLKGKNQLFKDIFFENEINEKSFIVGEGFAENSEPDSNKIKCSLTDQPVLKGREASVKIPSDDGLQELFVDKQARQEYEVGDKVVDNNTIIQYSDINNLIIESNGIFELGEKEVDPAKRKIVLNPILEILLKSGKDKISLLKNSRFIELANYTSKDGKNVLDFEKMSDDKDEGAKFLTVLKGDIDNLGLIMAYGLDNDLTAISRTTTLSNHLKYFFSFFINGFMKDKDVKEEIKSYIIFAGGDDLIFVCHQNNAVKLLDEFNTVFNDFVCMNKEVHISYSITHFKSGTPIRIVADFADENQEIVKKMSNRYDSINEMLLKEDCFFEDNNKSSTYIFETGLKNSELNALRSYTYLLASWVKENESDKNKGISMGILRNLMQLSEMMKAYREKKDTSKLIWHPMLTYMINRNLKRNDEYKDPRLKEIFDSVLNLSKNKEEIKLEKILYPAICGAIYKLRK